MGSKKETVLQVLKESGDYVSGQTLSEKLGVSRTAVWKIISGLKNDGYHIEAVTNKGYRLTGTGTEDLFNRQEIAERVRAKVLAGNIVFLQETDSTNLEAARLSDSGAAHGTLVVAAMQTKGRGRRGRNWFSPADANTYFSLLLRPDIPADKAPMLTLVAALAMAEAVQEMFDEGADGSGGSSCRAGIKWPNDIVACRLDGGENERTDDGRSSGWKKICGILTEMRLEESRIRDVIIGIGVNVNQMVIPEDLKNSASSIKLLAGQTAGRASVTAAFIDHFEPLYEAFIREQSVGPLRKEYEYYLVSMNRKVRILDPAGEYEGTAAGIDETGALTVVRDDDGSIVHISSGEVSVRGVEGYI